MVIITENGKHMKSRKNYILLSGALFFFFVTWSFWFSLFPIWLNQHLGLNGTDTGIIFSVNAIGALCLQPIYGYIQDKLGLKKNLVLILSLLLMLIAPFMIYVYAPLLVSNLYLGVALGAIYLGGVFFAGIGALESYIERISRISQFEFGQARMWGSLGWAFATFWAGRLITIDPDYNFYLASASATCCFILIALVKIESASPTTRDILKHQAESLSFNDALTLLKMPKFYAFVVYIMGCACIYGVYDQQFSVYFASHFTTVEEGNRMYGNLNSLQVFLEAGGMFLAPFIVNKIGPKNGLVFAGFVMAFRIIGSGMIESTYGISAMKLLHAVELPILLISIFKYFNQHFDSRLSATLYLFGFNFIAQVFTSILSPIVGASYDRIGFAETYIFLGISVTAFALLSCFTLEKSTNKDISDKENSSLTIQKKAAV